MSENKHKVYLRKGFAIAAMEGAIPGDNGQPRSVDDPRDRGVLFIRIFSPNPDSSFSPLKHEVLKCVEQKEVDDYLQAMEKAEPHPLRRQTTPDAVKKFFGPSVEIVP